MNNQTKVLFVCLGNIVRSPLAEAMLAHLAAQDGVGDKYVVDSAGTAAYHVGESPDSRMRRVSAARGLIYDGSGRQFTERDFDNFDLIIAMDGSNKSNILRLARKVEDHNKVHLLRDFDPDDSGTDDVPDPYYGGIDGFECVFDIVERSTKALLTALEAGSVGSE